MKRVATWESYLAVENILPAFESRIHEFIAFLRPIDKQLFDRTQQVTAEAGMVESISGMQVTLRIAAQRKRLGIGSEVVNALLFQLPYISNYIKKRKLFSEEVIPIQQLLVALGRLKNLIVMAKNAYTKQWIHDSDVFKPSNLDNEKIISLIEAAIDHIENGYPFRDKKQLVEYLNKAKNEFSENRPSWNKIVGALVIVAAIISGIADVDAALRNIDAAIKYILGTSIEQRMPSAVPLLREPHKYDGTLVESEFV